MARLRRRSASPSPADALDHRFRGEHPLRTLRYLFHDDRGKLALAVLAFAVKHSPIWLLPLITANVVDVVVAHKPISALWLNVSVLLLILFLNYPMHLLYVRCLSGSVRRMSTALRSALVRQMQQLSIGLRLAGYHARGRGHAQRVLHHADRFSLLLDQPHSRDQ